MAATRKLLQTLSLNRARAHQLTFVDLTSVKAIKFSFDPFHENVRSIRDMVFQLNVPKRRTTNMNCAMKVDVRSDRSPPSMEVSFADGHKAVYKTENLTAVEILQHFNKECQTRAIQNKPGKR